MKIRKSKVTHKLFKHKSSLKKKSDVGKKISQRAIKPLAMKAQADLKSTISKMQAIRKMNEHFLISERVVIGLRLEQLVGNRQGQRNDLGIPLKYRKMKNPDTALNRLSANMVGRKDEKIAEIIGLKSKNTYHRAKQVYFHGIQALIKAVDRREISISAAAKIVSLPPDQQQDFMQTRGVKSS